MFLNGDMLAKMEHSAIGASLNIQLKLNFYLLIHPQLLKSELKI